MKTLRKMVSMLLLAVCAAAQVAQAQATNGGAAQPVAAQRSAKPAKQKAKSQEQILLEQLNDKFNQIQDLSEKYDEVVKRLDAMERRLTTREAELEQAKKDVQAAQTAAADAKQKTDATAAVVGPAGSTVTKLQGDVADLKATSTSLAAKVETTEQKTTELEHPATIHFRGIELTPGGFLAAETVNRQRAIGGDINTQFSGIPFAGQTAGVLSEFNASGRAVAHLTAGRGQAARGHPARLL